MFPGVFKQGAIARGELVRLSDPLQWGYSIRVSQKSEPTNLGAPRVCSIADALELVGERWSLLVLRELGFGVHRFKDIQVNTGAPRETLALRLRKLEEAGVIERRRYCDRPPRDEYVLTAAGRELSQFLHRAARERERAMRLLFPASLPSQRSSRRVGSSPGCRSGPPRRRVR